MTKAETRKPNPEFPLFQQATGPWAKSIRGKLHDFGTEPDTAPEKYLDEREDLQAGRTPRGDRDGTGVKSLANRFLTTMEDMLAAGEQVLAIHRLESEGTTIAAIARATGPCRPKFD